MVALARRRSFFGSIAGAGRGVSVAAHGCAPVNTAAAALQLARPGAIKPTPAMPGAAESFAAIRAVGGRVLVVTAKYAPNAAQHLEHLDLAPDILVGWHWGPKKGEALLEHGATVYVGDHIADIHGARAAQATAVSVATGPVGAADLEAAGADVVLPDLLGFPPWLAGYLAA